MMIIREHLKDAEQRARIWDRLLPLQVALLMLSGLFVMRMTHINAFTTAMEDGMGPSPRMLRYASSAMFSHVDHLAKKGVVADLRKLYEGTRLDEAFVRRILQDGKNLLSQIDTIYNISLPEIESDEDAELSRKGLTVSSYIWVLYW